MFGSIICQIDLSHTEFKRYLVHKFMQLHINYVEQKSIHSPYIYG